jgi:uncharacterized protein YyaL (SSP411 family)
MNHLADETSPYLLQHARNPVDWHPWGEEAFARARDEDKPILLSIGYAACHWCHVMAHESFEDPDVARLMNERFVNVKVDREERPDVDAVYMDAVVALTGHGGWPMTVFLTPEREPFLGGTYFPPEPRHGLPSFTQVLAAVSDAYRERHGEVVQQARQLTEAIASSARAGPSSEPLTESLLAEAERGLRHGFDPVSGGWGTAPKFPPAPALEFLLRRDSDEARAMVRTTLDGMAAGGMYDLVGGGFHRYSVDARWLVPHFEKMLYDNALLAATYLHAWALWGEERDRVVVEQTLDYLLRELRLPDGAFASAQDADTDGVEGLTFTWTVEEGAPAELLEPFEDGRSVLRGTLDEETRVRLFDLREQRPKPARDDKAISSWNGLAIAALAEAGRRLGRAEYVHAGVAAAESVLREPELVRSRREGRTSGPGFLDDYANVAHGLLELHVATGDLRWLEEARRLAEEAVARFGDDAHGGFFLAPRDGERLVAEKKELDDHPIPSGNAMLAHVLLRVARIYGDDELERRAVGVFRLLRDAIPRSPSAFGWALVALDLHFSPPRELAVVGPPDSDVARAALAGWQPATVVAVGPAEAVPLLAGKGLVDGRPAVYVCERFACQAPETDPAAFVA